MQYKIPVQIENEDPIILGLSLRQLAIIMTGFGIAYGIFKSIEPTFGGELALLPSGIVASIGVAIAVFKIHHMSFVPFVLAMIRLSVNAKERHWQKGVDSHMPIDIGFITMENTKVEKKYETDSSLDKMKSLEDKLKKLK
ncbi:MAG: PrgI family protein [Candidatus Gracilibacteria bacterium]|nr:PrgI family protein [Candidatus Gracilibacteria bacterium]